MTTTTATPAVASSGLQRKRRDQALGALRNTWPTGPCTCIDTRAILVDPNAPDTVYVGTNGQGMFRSSNAGLSWETVAPELAGESILCLLQVPGQPSSLHACVADEGIWRSFDQGDSFVSASQGLGSGDISGLIRDAQTGELYATTGLGVFRSSDGTTWEGVDNRCLPLQAVSSPEIVHHGGTRLLVVGSAGAGVFALRL